jgi:hypothetical protein
VRALSRESRQFYVISDRELGIWFLIFLVIGVVGGSIVSCNIGMSPIVELWCPTQSEQVDFNKPTTGV